METLKKFWHWADNERPDRDLFDVKATAGGPLSEEAQEAMQQAVEVVGLRSPDCLHPTGIVLRSAIKLLSFAILEAWQLLKDDEHIQKALEEQALKRDEQMETTIRLLDHWAGQTVDIKSLTILPPIEETGVVRNYEHDVPAPKPLPLNAILGRLHDFLDGDEITMTYPDGTSRKGTIKRQGCGVYDFVEHVGKAKDIIADRMQTAAQQNRAHIERTLGHEADAVGYTAYNNAQNAGLARHYTGLAVDLKPLTIIPVIGEMGVTRSWEHDDYRNKLLDMMGPNDREHLHVRVDSRGILFQSTEFNDIEMHCDFSEFETQDPWRICEHKLYLVINTLRLDVVQRKADASRAKNSK